MTVAQLVTGLAGQAIHNGQRYQVRVVVDTQIYWIMAPFQVRFDDPFVRLKLGLDPVEADVKLVLDIG
jgi:hypothetical protein